MNATVTTTTYRAARGLLKSLARLAHRGAALAATLALGTLSALAAPPAWTPPGGLLNTMTLHAVVQRAGGACVSAPGSKMSAWKGAEIRGVTDIFNGPAVEMQFQLSVGSNLGAENDLELKVYDAATDQVFDVRPTFNFVADFTSGTVMAPPVYSEYTGPLRFTAAAPGTAAGLGSGTVTVAGTVTVLEDGAQLFTATPAGGTAPYLYTWTLAGTPVANSATYTYAPDFGVVVHPAQQNAGQQVRCTVTDSAVPPASATSTWSTVVTQDVDRAPATPVFAAPSVLPANPTTASTLSANATATDPDGDAVTYTVQWTHGATTIAAATLSPALTEKGQTWGVSVTANTNPYGLGVISSAPAASSVTIGNAAPVANVPAVALVIKDSVAVAIPAMTGTDPDVADGIDTLTFAIPGGLTTAAGGTLSNLDPAAGTVDYQPLAGHVGPDSFQFTVSDGTVTSAPATYSISVYAPFNLVIDVTGSEIDNLEIGTKGGATDGADVGIDALAPPVSNGDVGNVRLISPLPASPDPREYLNKDFRAILEGARFQIEVIPNAAGAAIDLSWDALDLPGGAADELDWHLWTLDAMDGVVQSGIDMSAVTSISVATDALQTPVYFMIGTPSAPTIATLVPAMGAPAGGTSVVISGTDFMTGVAVTFDGAAGTVTAQTATSITVTTPAHAYGLVDVVVTNPDGGTVTADDAFMVNTTPVANANGPYTIGLCSNLTLDASASVDADSGAGDTLSYAWDLDNNGSFETGAAGPTLVRTAAQLGNPGPGTYDIAVRVTDSNGATDTATTTYTVANQNPVAAAGGPYVIDEGGALQLDASGSSDPDVCDSVTLYEWELDGLNNDFNERVGNSPTPPELPWSTLVALGLDDLNVAQPISLRVTDQNGGTHVAHTTVTVYRNLPVAAFTMTPNPAARMTDVVFDGTTSSHGKPGVAIVSYEWDFDYNGVSFVTRATGATRTYRFPRFGNYTVALRVTDQNGRANTATDVLVVSVGNTAPVVNSAGGPYAIDAGQDLTLTGSATDAQVGLGDMIVSYLWDVDNDGSFDDGVGHAVTLTWAQLRTILGISCADRTKLDVDLDVTLQVTDSFGAAGTLATTLHITYAAPALDAVAGAGDYSVAVMSALSLDGSASTGYGLTYAWDLDDDGQYDDATGATPTLTPAQVAALGLTENVAGTIRLQVTDCIGCIDIDDTLELTVTNDPDVDPTGWTFPLNVAFGSEWELILGVAPTGDQGFDAFDGAAAGPMPDGALTVLHVPSGGTTLWKAINSNDVDGNSTADYADWILEVTAGVQPCIIWWDNVSVPAAGMWLIDLGNPGSVPEADGRIPAGAERIDMSDPAAYIEVLPFETRYYRVVFGALKHTVALATGWNMISLPNEPFDSEVPGILSHANFVPNTNYGWDPVTQGYVDGLTGGADEFLGLSGYWVYFSAPATVVIDGIRINDRNYDLVKAEGWHLVGVAAARALEDHPDLFLPGYYFNASTGLFEAVGAGSMLQPGLAYWFYALESTMLNPQP
jgi:hypothetical protein